MLSIITTFTITTFMINRSPPWCPASWHSSTAFTSPFHRRLSHPTTYIITSEYRNNITVKITKHKCRTTMANNLGWDNLGVVPYFCRHHPYQHPELCWSSTSASTSSSTSSSTTPSPLPDTTESLSSCSGILWAVNMEIKESANTHYHSTHGIWMYIVQDTRLQIHPVRLSSSPRYAY